MNTYAYLCPLCHRGAGLWINNTLELPVTETGMVHDGLTATVQDEMFDARCSKCRWTGSILDLRNNQL